jgi:hypothetical protein
MKQVILSILLVACSSQLFAQEAHEHHSVVGFHIGSAIAGSVYLAEDNWKPIVNKKPVTQLTYDHMLRKGFSIGATFAYQSIDLTLVDTFQNSILEEGKLNRIYIGGRALWHYGKKKRWDLYSGVKFGLILFSSSQIINKQQEPAIIEDKHNRSSPRIGVIPIGCRYHLTETIAIGAQWSVGVPTIATFNINYAF